LLLSSNALLVNVDALLAWQNQRSVLEITSLTVCLYQRKTQVRHQSSSLGGDGVTICQYFEILTASMNTKQEKKL
jgi:hypothetical protein